LVVDVDRTALYKEGEGRQTIYKLDADPVRSANLQVKLVGEKEDGQKEKYHHRESWWL